MRRAIAVASLGLGSAAPNPLVGAVVARAGKVLGQAYHRRAGELHAEALVLERVGTQGRRATLYTNLEPCCHTGRTPPCVDNIVRAGISRVVVPMRDPNPKVNGRGLRYLRRRGVQVHVGLLRGEAVQLNRAFLKYNKTGLPFVTIKSAATLDGRIATVAGDSKWITSAETRKHARLLRREHEALMIGVGTALADDPQLTAFRVKGRPPLLRVVLDSRARLPTTSALARGARQHPLLVFCTALAPAAALRQLSSVGASVEVLPHYKGRIDIGRALEALGRRGITRLLVEGGGEVHASLLQDGLADRLVLYLAPRLMGGRDSRPLIGGAGPRLLVESYGLRQVRSCRVGSDWLIDADIVSKIQRSSILKRPITQIAYS